jgi:putative membrane protein
MRGLKGALFLLGLSLLGLILWRVGFGPVLAALQPIGWGVVVLIVAYLPVWILDTLGWRFAFPADSPRVPLLRLLRIRLSGEAFNVLMPTLDVGGEAVKTLLLRREGVPTVQALASVVVAKTSLAVAEVFFLLAGMGVAMQTFALPVALQRGVGLSLLVGGAGVVTFLLLQRRGLFGSVAALSRRLGLARRFWREQAAAVAALDETLRAYYARPGRGALSVAFHLLGWLAGVLEVVLILRFLDLPVTAASALALEAGHQLFRAAAFFIPAKLGAQEGGSLIVFSALGFPAAVGVAVSLLRRVRELAWVALGLLLLAGGSGGTLLLGEVGRP